MDGWVLAVAFVLLIAFIVVPLAEFVARRNPERPRNLAFRTRTSAAGAILIVAAFGALVAGFSVGILRLLDASEVPTGVGWVCWIIGVAGAAFGIRLRAGDPESAFLVRSTVQLACAVLASLVVPTRYLLVGVVAAGLLARALVTVWQRRSRAETSA